MSGPSRSECRPEENAAALRAAEPPGENRMPYRDPEKQRAAQRISKQRRAAAAVAEPTSTAEPASIDAPVEAPTKPPEVAVMDALWDELDDLVVWDNARNEVLHAARPFMRDHRLLRPGAPFTVRAAVVDGRWRGPEAEHVQDLMRLGLVQEASEAVIARTRRQAARDEEIGAFDEREEVDPKTGVVTKYRLTSFAEKSYEEMRAMLRPHMGSTVEELMQREHDERRAAVREMQELRETIALAREAIGLAVQTSAQRSGNGHTPPEAS
jgi:hypothetical protein